MLKRRFPTKDFYEEPQITGSLFSFLLYNKMHQHVARK